MEKEILKELKEIRKELQTIASNLEPKELKIKIGGNKITYHDQETFYEEP